MRRGVEHIAFRRAKYVVGRLGLHQSIELVEVKVLNLHALAGVVTGGFDIVPDDLPRLAILVVNVKPISSPCKSLGALVLLGEPNHGHALGLARGLENHNRLINGALARGRPMSLIVGVVAHLHGLANSTDNLRLVGNLHVRFVRNLDYKDVIGHLRGIDFEINRVARLCINNQNGFGVDRKRLGAFIHYPHGVTVGVKVGPVGVGLDGELRIGSGGLAVDHGLLHGGVLDASSSAIGLQIAIAVIQTSGIDVLEGLRRGAVKVLGIGYLRIDLEMEFVATIAIGRMCLADFIML